MLMPRATDPHRGPTGPGNQRKACSCVHQGREGGLGKAAGASSRPGANKDSLQHGCLCQASEFLPPFFQDTPEGPTPGAL